MKQRFTTFMSTLLLSVFFAVSASAYDVEVDGLYYNLKETEKTAEVTYKVWMKASYSGSIEIPSFIFINEVEYIPSLGIAVIKINGNQYYYPKTAKEVGDLVTSPSIGGEYNRTWKLKKK